MSEVQFVHSGWIVSANSQSCLQRMRWKKPDGYDVSKYTTEVFRMFSTDEAIDCDIALPKTV